MRPGRAPNVVDEHIDVAVVFANLFGQAFHLVGFEMIDCGRNTAAAEMRDKLGSLFDGLGTVVVGPGCSCTATGANDCGTGFAQGSRDATPGTSGRPRHDGDASTQCFSIWRPPIAQVSSFQYE